MTSTDEKQLPPSEELRDSETAVDQDNSITNKSLVEIPSEAKPAEVTFPEGGARAWSVVLGTSCILFCTFGYANAFGYEDLISTSVSYF